MIRALVQLVIGLGELFEVPALFLGLVWFNTWALHQVLTGWAPRVAAWWLA